MFFSVDEEMLLRELVIVAFFPVLFNFCRVSTEFSWVLI